VPRFFWGGAHIFHSFDFIPEFFRSVATIATVHDVTFLNVPEVYIDHTFPRLLDAGLRRTLPLCEAVITVSQQSKSDIVEHYGYPAERVYVAYNWVSDELLTASSRQALLPAVCDRPYILSVGTVQPNKNYHTTIEAFARLAGKLPHTYVIAGRSDFGPAYTRQLQQRIAELGLSDRIHFLGAVDDALLAALYRNAGLLLFPSYHEGFGFPLIEAMHFGVPIVTSNAGSMPEVACDAALQVTPTDIVAMAEAIEAAVTDDSVRARLLAAARLGRNRFSKDRAVRTVLGVYDSIL
jgi:glycosyltransferase involved in cell wall biosynthesis